MFYYMRADDIEQVFESFEESTHDIDEEHKQVVDEVLESGENIGGYELLYHRDNPERPLRLGQFARPIYQLIR